MNTLCMTTKLIAARGEVREHLTFICACAESSSKRTLCDVSLVVSTRLQE